MTNCPACDEIESKTVRRLPLVQVVECPRCGLHFCVDTDERSNQKVVDTDPEFFHGLRGTYAEQSEIAHRIVPRRMEAYERLLGRPVRSILEIGCATGAYAKAYAQHGVRYMGLELEPDLARAAKESTALDIRQGNFLEMDFQEEFDVVFASQVFEHIVTPAAFLKKAGSIASNGLVHIDVPNHKSLAARARKIFSSKDYGFIQPPYHLIAYDDQSLAFLVRSAGFKTMILEAKRNDDPVWGQLIVNPSIISKLIFVASGGMGIGSLLTFVGKPSLSSDA